MQCLGAKAQMGADLLFRLAHFDEMLRGATVVVSGEGCADRQTLMGKFPQRVLHACRQQGVPVWLVAGHVADADDLRSAGFAQVVGINPPGQPLAESLRPDVARANLTATLRRLAQRL